MIANLNAITHIGESVFQKDFSQLNTFFCNVWKKPHSYIVLFGRQCLNLNEVFMQKCWNRGDRVANAGRIISDNALLLYSDSLADYYNEWSCFPSILLVGDTLYYGRNVSRFLYVLEELVVSRLQQSLKRTLTMDDRYYIHRDLATAVDIYVFGVNRQQLLLDDSYLQKLRAETQRCASELRTLSQQIAIFLRRVGIPNTSYTLSCALPNTNELHPTGWLRQDWTYRGNSQAVFFRSKDISDGSLSILSTVRTTATSLPAVLSGEDDGEVNLCGMAIFDEISTEDINRVCRDFLSKLSESGLQLKTICRILSLEHPLYQKPRVQFLSFLLSVACLRSFFGDLSDEFGEDFPLITTNDMQKIFRNFAFVQGMASDLDALFKNPEWDSVEKCLFDSISLNARPFLKHGIQHEPVDMGAANTAAESMLYETAMKSEKRTWQTAERQKRFCPEEPDPDTTPLCRHIPAVSNRKTEAHQLLTTSDITCLTAMVDNGLANTDTQLRGEGESTKIQCVFKPSVLATFIIPRQYLLFIPALAQVERNCHRLTLDRQTVAIQFIESLPESPPDAEVVARESTGMLESEAVALKNLKTHGADFVRRLYECGQSLDGWDIDWVTAEEWRGSGEQGSYYSFAIHSMARQKVYIRLADEFLCER